MDVDEDDTQDSDVSVAEDQVSNENDVEEDEEEEEIHTVLGENEIPEGVDPEFLAALPEDIRAEVIGNHLLQQRAERINRATTVTTDAAVDNQNITAAEDEVIDQEFLTALPPELQEEILAEREQQLAWRNRRGSTVLSAFANADNIEVHGLAAREFHSLFESMFHVLQSDFFPQAHHLRANFRRQQMFRFAHYTDHDEVNTSYFRRYRNVRDFMSRISSIEKKGAQIFDRESLITLLLLHYMDQEKFHSVLLQNSLRLLCLHSGTCDNVIWSLLSILNVLDNGGEDNSALPYGGSLDSFYVKKALTAVAKELKITLNGVKFDEKLRLRVCGLVFDTLSMLTKSFPQHFLPSNIRVVSRAIKRFYSVPDLSSLWNMDVENTIKTNEDIKPSMKEFVQFREIVPSSLEKTPMAFLLKFVDTNIIRNNINLMDKLMKILNIITQFIPSNSHLKMNDVSVKWLTNCLQTLAKLILETCRGEGLKDSQNFFIEIIRIFPSQRFVIFNMLYNTVEEQSELIKINLIALKDELNAFNLDLVKTQKGRKKSVDESATTDFQTTLFPALGRPRATTVEDEEEPETDFQIKALKGFTDRNALPNKLLKSLEIISFLRTRLKLINDRRLHASALTEFTSAPNAVPSTSGVKPSLPTSSITSSGEGIGKEEEQEKKFTALLEKLEPLWTVLSACMEKMSQTLGSTAVLTLQRVAEAFFLAHSFFINCKKVSAAIPSSLAQSTASLAQSTASLAQSTAPLAQSTAPLAQSGNGADAPPHAHLLPLGSLFPSAAVAQSGQLFPELPQPTAYRTGGGHLRIVEQNKYTKNMFRFAEKNRMVLNQILRSTGKKWIDETAYAILTCFPKLLDFDVKRKFFYKEIRKVRERVWYEDVVLRVRRNHLFGDSFRELIRVKPSDWRAHFYVIFEGEEGQDGGGLTREWFTKITRDIFNPNYGLFITAPGDRVTYMINKSSYVNPEHLNYFRFVGCVIAKAIYENRQLNCYFTRAFYKHILNVPVRYQDIESEDPSFFKSLEYLLNNPVEECAVDLTFSVEVEEFGERSVRNLKDDGDRIPVTDANKDEYVQQVCQMKMTGSIRKQLDAFLEGFYEVIPKKLISIFNEQELELLISGLPEINIDDLHNNTEYKSYTRESPQIEWLWIALRSFEQEDLAKFLQFVTGTSKVPLQGFSHLEGMNGVQKLSIHADSSSHNRLPTAHTCFNQLDLPKYKSYEELRKMLLLAIRECSEGFAFN